MKFLLICFIITFCFIEIEASSKCVEATGVMRCHKDPEKHANVKIYLMDRDGIGILQRIDPDDKMTQVN
jgi:hypothetical protein